MRRPATVAILALLALAPAPAPAEAAGPSCHCFRDREYDPANPAASDAYLLATASNSLLAAAAGMPKGDIVQALMSGTAGADLWVAAHAARRRGGTVRTVLQARAGVASWRELFTTGGWDLEALGPRFVAALASGGGDAALARVAAAATLAERIGAPWDQLDALAGRGASYQELVAAALIGRWAGKPALEVLDAARGAAGWSSQLAATGKVPKGVEAEIRTLLAAPRPRPDASPR